MRRAVTSALIIVLSLMLVLPTVALAKGWPPAGKGPGAPPPGQAKKLAPAAVSTTQAEEPAEEQPAEEELPAESVSPGTGAAKAAQKAEREAAKTARQAGKTERAAQKAGRKAVSAGKGAGAAAVASVEESGSVESSASPEPEAPAKLTGIANALSRILASIERAEARVAEGKKSAVPPGLLKVLAKFMGWLGIEPEPEPGSDPVGEDPAIEEPTEGSEEETGTLLPETGSEEDTDTVAPELAE